MGVPIEYKATCSAGLDIVAISLDDWLDSGELAASISASENTSTDVTIANAAVSTGSLIINRKTVTTGRAVQFSITGQTATGGPASDGLYTFDVQVTTDSTPVRDQTFTITIQCV